MKKIRLAKFFHDSKGLVGSSNRPTTFKAFCEYSNAFILQCPLKPELSRTFSEAEYPFNTS